MFYGGVVTINFADMVWRIALTTDFETLLPMTAVEDLSRSRVAQ
jgi:hypothetical protein